MFETELMNIMKNAKYGNRSYTKQILAQIIEQGREQEVAECVLETVAFTISHGIPLTGACRKVANRIFRIMGTEEEPNDRRTIRLGADCIDWVAKCGLVKAEKFSVIENGGKEQYFLSVIDEDFFKFVDQHSTGAIKANLGVTPWDAPVMKVGDRSIDIVKSARRYNLLSNYRYSKMPDVYSALNRLNETTWKVNSNMLSVLAGASYTSFSGGLIPATISDPERRAALAEINKADRTALWLSEIKFKELVEKGFEEEKAEKIAETTADEFKMTRQFDHLEVISAWSKRMDFERCIKLAQEYAEDELNFIYQTDSRGRCYAVQHGLNPQGADFAKSLLVFARPKPISTYDFYVTLANHAGQDKKSYDDRIKWVEENADSIYEVGSNPLSEESIEWLTETGIMREKKSKFQFVAAAMEFTRLHDFLREGGDVDEFLCEVPVGYDASNSGLAILSGIGRDEKVAPLVNITATEKPGDVYAYIGQFVADEKPVEKLEVFGRDEKIWRKICKRNVMTKCYAATRIGMGDQQWEDRKDYGSDVTDSLTVKECRTLGASVYDICSTKLEKASALMETMRKCTSKVESSIVTWELPTGFTAFQVKDKSKEDVLVGATIGDDKVNLTFYTFTDIPNRAKHSNAIAPDVVHSIDAWLLMSVVNDMPSGANLHFIHDQFGSDSCHGEDIQDAAKLNFKHCVSRTVFQVILEQIAKDEVTLPEAGEYDINEANAADYMFS